MREILSIVRRNGVATTQELAEKLGVSLSTIRRDIAELTRSGLVNCSRNIIVPVSELQTDAPMSFRSSINAQAKTAISREAVKLVKNGSTVFLDSSSTVLPMVNMLHSISSLVIVTNGLNIVQRLQNSRFTVHVVGGEMSRLSQGFYGPIAEAALRGFNFDMAFFSPVAVTKDGYVAETTVEAAAMRRVALEQASAAALLFDHTKIGFTRPYNFARLDDFAYIITDDTKNDFNTTATVRRVHI